MRENEAVSCLSGGLQEGAEIEKSAFYPMRPTEVVQQVKFKATIVCENSRKNSSLGQYCYCSCNSVTTSSCTGCRRFSLGLLRKWPANDLREQLPFSASRRFVSGSAPPHDRSKRGNSEQPGLPLWFSVADGFIEGQSHLRLPRFFVTIS